MRNNIFTICVAACISHPQPGNAHLRRGDTGREETREEGHFGVGLRTRRIRKHSCGIGLWRYTSLG